MGKMKDIFMDFEDSYAKNDDVWGDSFIFKLNLYQKITLTNTKAPNDLERFFNDVFKNLNEKEKVWIMAERQGLRFNISFSDTKEALNALSSLVNEDVNLYYSPAIYSGWRKDDNVVRLNTLYADIDDLEDIDLSKMSKKDIQMLLTSEYNVPEALLPDWVVISGHGLHLYYLIDSLDMKDEMQVAIRKKYTEALIAYFKADIACRNKSRILRFPTSKNVKHLDDIRQTKLFHLNQGENRDIHRLDSLIPSSKEIDAYISEQQDSITKKRLETMKRNGTDKRKKTKANAPTSNIIKKDTVSFKDDTIYKATKKQKKKGKVSEPSHPELRVNNTKMSNSSRYRRIVRDLHNYAARRKGVPIGKRAKFTHLLAVYLRYCQETLNDAKVKARSYIDTSFISEADEIVEAVYARKKNYIYKNATIAEWLEFTSKDLEATFATYTEEQRKAAKRERDRRYREKKKKQMLEEQGVSNPEFRYDYILLNPDLMNKQLAQDLRCSVRTVQYTKALIRKDTEAV